MPKYILVDQGSKEWLDLRRQHVTATDAAKLMGSYPYGKWTPLKLFETKMLGEEVAVNDFMRWGTKMEPVARAIAEKELDFPLIPSVFTDDWRLVSLDGWNEECQVCLEVKCTTDSEIFLKAEDEEIPEHWKDQMTWQMIVMGIKAMWLIVFSPDEKYVLFRYDLDPKRARKIEKTCEEFWKCMKEMEAPPMTEDDFLVIDDEDGNNWAKIWIEENEKLKRQEKFVKDIRQKVLDSTDDGNCIFSKAGLKVSRTKGRKTVDWKSVCERYQIRDEILKEFTKEGIGYPIFTVMEDKDGKSKKLP